MTAEKWTIWDRFFKWLSRWFVRRKDFDEAMRDGQDARNEVCDLEADRDYWRKRAEWSVRVGVEAAAQCRQQDEEVPE